jgi:hypothetical protein
MLRLEDLTHGMTVRGLSPAGPVAIRDLGWLDATSVEVHFQDAQGNVVVRVLSRQDEASLELAGSAGTSLFSGDPVSFRLSAEALRIRLASMFDPFLAIHTSLVEPLPHQVLAVYKEFLHRQPIRFLLADGPGSGRRTTAALLLRELSSRGQLHRCLILCPGFRAEAWQEELAARFDLPFEILTNEQTESARVLKTMAETNFAIVRLEKLSRDADTKLRLDRPEWGWDLTIIDEAQRVQASYSKGELLETDRFKMCAYAARKSRSLLLLSAAPHNGNEEEFQILLSLLDSERFEGPYREGIHATGAADLGRRIGKEHLLGADGSPLFGGRELHTCSYSLSEPEANLRSEVVNYALDQLGRADRLDSDRRRALWLSLSILLRRLSSSPEAVFQALYHRRRRLEALLAEAEALKNTALATGFLAESASRLTEDEEVEIEEAPAAEREQKEETVADRATAARNPSELTSEVGSLKKIESLAAQLFKSGADSKWEALCRVLEYENLMLDSMGDRHKVVILTEHKDTLDYVASRVLHLLGKSGSVVLIHAGMDRDRRLDARKRFLDDGKARFLIATDDMLEGSGPIGSHLFVNYDLQWSASRLERRLGLTLRIGQSETCHVWNVLVSRTPESGVFHFLFDRVHEEWNGGTPRVFENLGQLFRDEPLAHIVLREVRSAGEPDREALLHKTFLGLANRELARQLLEERAIPRMTIDPRRAEELREEVSSAVSSSLMPGAIGAFFRESLDTLGGSQRECEAGRWEISRFPEALRAHERRSGRRTLRTDQPLRITFDSHLVRVDGQPDAVFISPGHPLLQALSAAVLERNPEVLRLGAALVDPASTAEEPRALFLVEQVIADGRKTTGGTRNIVARTAGLAEIHPDGSVEEAWLPSYLALRPPSEEEKPAVDRLLMEPWLWEDLSTKALTWTMATFGTNLIAQWRGVKERNVARTRDAVTDRMLKEIAFWDRRATTLTSQGLEGRRTAEKPGQAAKRAEILQARLRSRLDDLERERALSVLAPIVLARVVVVPAGLLQRLKGEWTRAAAGPRAPVGPRGQEDFR